MKTTKDNFQFEDSGFRRFILQFLTIIMKRIANIDVIHPERIVPDGAIMVAANHITSTDAILLQVVIPRILCFMSKAELFQNPLSAWFFNKIGSFPVKRGEFDRQSLLNAKNVLDSGLALMMFPEGTRTFGRGMIQARSGSAHLAMRNGCAILPVAILGAENILKHGLKKVNVTVEFGLLISPGEYETAQALTQRLMKAIAAMLPEGYRGVYS
jgi:1-acyl-sn-glycerol-3-phosphate acyltransferase